MRARAIVGLGLVVTTLAAACGDGSATATPDMQPDLAPAAPPWVEGARILVQGSDTEMDCRDHFCRHNENTDEIVWQGAIWMVHRTARSQILGPNSSLHVYKYVDYGASYVETTAAPILAPTAATYPTLGDRDLRDPAFYLVGDQLYIKALTRVPMNLPRDADVDTVSVETHSSDGVHWSPLNPIGPHGWSFWRIKQSANIYYTAAYQDGDQSVVLYSSSDGLNFTAGAPIYTVAADTPLETELTFLPSGKLLATVRTDGTDAELLGNTTVHTHLCWASPPYDQFACPSLLSDQRLDGPVSFFWQSRLFVIARRHLGTDGRKRTALFELTGDLDAGPLTAKVWGDLPSAGDTSYAGVAPIAGDPNRFAISWYSGDLTLDQPWIDGIFDATDIWVATIDLSKLQ